MQKFLKSPVLLGTVGAVLVAFSGSAMAELPAGVETAFTTLMTDFGTMAAAAGVAIVGIPLAIKAYAIFKRLLSKA